MDVELDRPAIALTPPSTVFFFFFFLQLDLLTFVTGFFLLFRITSQTSLLSLQFFFYMYTNGEWWCCGFDGMRRGGRRGSREELRWAGARGLLATNFLVQLLCLARFLIVFSEGVVQLVK